MKIGFVVALACTIVATSPARATEVIPYTLTALTAADPIQLGRLTRARPPSNWAETTPFPGITTPNTPYQFRAIDVAFAVNALQDVYYEITVDDPDAVIFASAYAGGYDPLAPAAHYLGDEGSSGNYFPGDPSFFQVAVPKGQALSLVFNSVGTPNPSFAYQVSAFSDTMYDEDFKTTAVPEPASWMLMLIGMGAAGFSLRLARPRRSALQA